MRDNRLLGCNDLLVDVAKYRFLRVLVVEFFDLLAIE